MIVKTWAEWKDAVAKEYEKLRACEKYLSDDGKARLKAFAMLDDLTGWADSAKEMWGNLNDGEMLSEHERRVIWPDGHNINDHLGLAVSRLLRISEKE